MAALTLTLLLSTRLVSGLVPVQNIARSALTYLTHPAHDCYWPDGHAVDIGYAGACSAQGGSCCPAGWECLDNGLCRFPNEAYDLPDRLNFTIRYSCQRDKGEGRTPTPCSDICGNQDRAWKRTSIYSEVLQCPDGRWCCNSDGSDNCCSGANYDPGLFFNIPQPKVVRTIPTMVAVHKTVTITTSSDRQYFVSTGIATTAVTNYKIVSTTTTVLPSGAVATYTGARPSNPTNDRAHFLLDLIESPNARFPKADRAFVHKTRFQNFAASRWPIFAIPLTALGLAALASGIGLGAYFCLRRRRRAREAQYDASRPDYVTQTSASPYTTQARTNTASYGTGAGQQSGMGSYEQQPDVRTEVRTVPETRTNVEPA